MLPLPQPLCLPPPSYPAGTLQAHSVSGLRTGCSFYLEAPALTPPRFKTAQTASSKEDPPQRLPLKPSLVPSSTPSSCSTSHFFPRGPSNIPCNSLPRFIFYYVSPTTGLPRWLSGKASACQCRRHEFYPWVGKIPGEGNGKAVQCSCLENPMDRGTWWATAQT